MPVLVVQHQSDAPPGLVGDWLTSSGVRLDVVRPDLGEALPESMTEENGYTGLLVLGGAMGAYDDEDAPWLPRVRALLASAVHRAVPTLGICLGHQLLAAATGGTVERHPRGRRMGTVPVHRHGAAADDPLFGVLDWPAPAVRWHQDVVASPPPEAEVLAIGDGDVHGLRVGHCAWSIQAHPEATEQIVTTWAERTEQNILAARAAAHSEHGDTEQGSTPGTTDGRGSDVKAVRDAVASVVRHRSELAAAWEPFARAFADQVATANRGIEQPPGRRHAVG